MPSTPAAPLLRLTCASAFLRLSRSTIASIDGLAAARLSISVVAARASVPSASALRASPVAPPCKVISISVFCRMAHARSPFYLPFHVWAFGGLLHLLCPLLTSPPRSRTLRSAQSGLPDAPKPSRGKIDRLHRTPAGFTTPVLDGRGLRDPLLARPAG